MFEKPDYVFKNGELVAKRGKIVKVVNGGTHTLRPDYDRDIEKSLRKYFDRYLTMRLDNFALSDGEIENNGRGHLVVHACKARS